MESDRNTSLEMWHMRVESRGFQTDLIFWRAFGHVTDRGEYLVVETPSNYGWYFGNLLVFEKGPREGDFARWPALFRREFAHAPQVKHMVLTWRVEGDDFGTIGSFINAGFRLEVNPVLIARELHPPPRPNREIEVRAVSTLEEWDAVLEMQVLCRDARHEESAYRRFVERRFEGYKQLAAQGRGGWHCAYIDDKLVANLGFFNEGGVGRYQYVETHPDYRRRGICGTLIYTVGSRALREQGVRELVISAEGKDVARLYESVGFEKVEHCAALVLYPEGGA